MTLARSGPPAAKSGRNRTTGSASRSLPSWTRSITDGAVATVLVRDARSKIVSTVIGSTDGATARFPKAFRNTIFLLCPTRTTAPGNSFRAIAWRTTASIPGSLSAAGRAGTTAAVSRRTAAIMPFP